MCAGDTAAAVQRINSRARCSFKHDLLISPLHAILAITKLDDAGGDARAVPMQCSRYGRGSRHSEGAANESKLDFTRKCLLPDMIDDTLHAKCDTTLADELQHILTIELKLTA